MPPRGRKPTPTHLKVMSGNPGKRPLNKREPKLPAAIPACPTHIKGQARKEWRRVSLELLDAGLIAKLDRPALAAYCQAWARWVEAEESLQKYGMVIKAPSGYPIQSPFLAVANKAMEQMRAFLTEFGMTPSSRSRVVANPVRDASNPFQALA